MPMRIYRIYRTARIYRIYSYRERTSSSFLYVANNDDDDDDLRVCKDSELKRRRARPKFVFNYLIVHNSKSNHTSH